MGWCRLLDYWFVGFAAVRHGLVVVRWTGTWFTSDGGGGFVWVHVLFEFGTWYYHSLVVLAWRLRGCGFYVIISTGLGVIVG